MLLSPASPTPAWVDPSPQGCSSSPLPPHCSQHDSGQEELTTAPAPNLRYVNKHLGWVLAKSILFEMVLQIQVSFRACICFTPSSTWFCRSAAHFLTRDGLGPQSSLCPQLQ